MDRRLPLTLLRRVAVLAVAAFAIVAVAGCGGSEEDDARDVVKEYARAIADGDEREVCATLSEQSKKQFERADTKCEGAYKNFGAFLNRDQKDGLRNIDPEVKVDGDRATTRVEERPLEGEVRLTKEDGQWKISSR